MGNGKEKPLSYRKIADRYYSAREALDAHAAEKILMKGEFHVAKWLYMADIENESRLDYMMRCRKQGILKADGIRKCEKLLKAKMRESQEKAEKGNRK